MDLDRDSASVLLIEAAYNADADAVADLLRTGAKSDVSDNNGFTALHWCAFRGAVSPRMCDIADMLISAGADVNAVTNPGDTVLCFAIDSGNQQLVKELLRRGAQPNLRSNGVTPLMRAAACGSEEIVRILAVNRSGR
jgi:ankyrin repeat protein